MAGHEYGTEPKMDRIIKRIVLGLAIVAFVFPLPLLWYYWFLQELRGK